ncbi:sensor domain-containing diguanylate cyclase [Aureimonas populi]|uniref:Diguanylate cyclase domain-containing protein n=1 Tax=Aureimonas populi TaxID=1701758 RepID=A0ABW5CJY8_9HYPH|nr:GGDEF domain-containing protein [Aureimonas populi]
MPFVQIDDIGVPAFVLAVGTDGFRFLGINAAYEGLSGLSNAEVAGRPLRECLSARAAEMLHRRYSDCVATGVFKDYEERLSLPCGRRWFHTLLNPVRDPQSGRVYKLVGIAIDITERKRLERELEKAALTDDLTGLANRRGFVVCAEDAQDAAEDEQARLGLIVVDLDGFKAINDRHGHLVGDEVLKQVARRMRAALPEAEVVARLGGDEFVALVRVEGEEHLGERAATLGERLCAPLVLEGYPALDMGASVGAALWAPGATLSGVMAFADSRMYAAKGHRRRAA